MTESPEGRAQTASSSSAQTRADEEARWSAWMVQAQKGDSEAYRELLGELDRVLRSYLRRILGDAGLVDDGVQETLMAVHKARHTYEASRPFRPWLVAIARHKAIDLLRRGRTPTGGAASDDTDGHLAGSSENRPEAGLEVARLLDGLPASFREAIVLTKIQGQTVEEAAGKAGVSTTAMRTRVHRGMRQLRKVLEGEPL